MNRGVGRRAGRSHNRLGCGLANRPTSGPLVATSQKRRRWTRWFSVSTTWTQPPAGQFGTAAPYYSDYRYKRTPSENASIARIFRVKERVSIQIRAEWFNIFNRLAIPLPSATNALATQTRTATGTTQSGFGAIVTSSGEAATGPRNGQLLMKVIF